VVVGTAAVVEVAVVVAKPDPQSSAVGTRRDLLPPRIWIHSLCHDREEEIFFHYSEVGGTHPDGLQMNTESSFR
jgi:hypothetical protein